MLELFGSGYIIDHCVSAFLEEQEEMLYKTYITDALKCIGRLDNRFYNLYMGMQQEKQEEKDGDTIAFEVIQKCGLKVV